VTDLDATTPSSCFWRHLAHYSEEGDDQDAGIEDEADKDQAYEGTLIVAQECFLSVVEGGVAERAGEPPIGRPGGTFDRGGEIVVKSEGEDGRPE
jgi:hypothetical protein